MSELPNRFSPDNSDRTRALRMQHYAARVVEFPLHMHPTTPDTFLGNTAVDNALAYVRPLGEVIELRPDLPDICAWAYKGVYLKRLLANHSNSSLHSITQERSNLQTSSSCRNTVQWLGGAFIFSCGQAGWLYEAWGVYLRLCQR